MAVWIIAGFTTLLRCMGAREAIFSRIYVHDPPRPKSMSKLITHPSPDDDKTPGISTENDKEAACDNALGRMVRMHQFLTHTASLSTAITTIVRVEC